MHIMWKVVALALFLFCDSVALASPAAGAETVVGTVGWVFADAKPGTDPQAGYFRMFLDTDDGRRLPRDVDVLRRAETDPYALLGKRVRAHVEAVDVVVSGLNPATPAAKSAVARLWPEDAPLGKAAAAADEGLRGSIPWQVLTCPYRGMPDVPVSGSHITAAFSDEAGHIGAYWKLVSKALIDIHRTRVTPEWVEVPGAHDDYLTDGYFEIVSRHVV